MIDPAFWQSESVAQLPIAARYFFIGLFSNADDQGRMKAHPALIRSKLYPYDDISLDEISEWLDLLVADEFIIVYENDGKGYLQITNWWKYQRPRWAWPSEHPAPEGWADRVHYRKGNMPVKENWDQDETEPETESKTSETTVAPQWTHNGPTVEPAPSISTRTSISSSSSSSQEDPAPDGAPPPEPEHRTPTPH